MPLLAAVTKPSVTTPALLAPLTFKLVFVCPAFSRVPETAWWNTEVPLAALRRRGNKKGIKTFSQWHCREQMLLILKQLACTLLYSMRVERIITLTMSDTKICKRTVKCARVKISRRLFRYFSLSSFFFSSLSSSATQPPCFYLTPHKLVLYCLPQNRNSLFGALKLLWSPLSRQGSWFPFLFFLLFYSSFNVMAKVAENSRSHWTNTVNKMLAEGKESI